MKIIRVAPNEIIIELLVNKEQEGVLPISPRWNSIASHLKREYSMDFLKGKLVRIKCGNATYAYRGILQQFYLEFK